MNANTVVLTLALFGFLCCSGTKAEVTQCYQCDTECDTPKVQNCTDTGTGVDGGWACISSTASAEGVSAAGKSCIPLNQGKTICEALNKVKKDSCYTCTENLCNSAQTYSFSIMIISVFVCLFKFL